MRLSEMQGYGVGVIGLQPSEFLNIEVTEFIDIVNAYNEARDAELQTKWEIGRMIAYWSVVPNLKKDSRFKPQDIIEFDWEKKKKQEDIKRLKEMNLKDVFPKTLKVGKK